MGGKEAATSPEGRITSPVLPSSDPYSRDVPHPWLTAVVHQCSAVLYKEMEVGSKTWAGEVSLREGPTDQQFSVMRQALWWGGLPGAEQRHGQAEAHTTADLPQCQL